jgi:antirestriction protein ArdC
MESYLTLSLHEHVHWSGCASRLNRYSLTPYGKEHAMEELVAELRAVFLCSHLQVSQKLREIHTDYFDEWLQLLKHDTQAVFKASALAAKACDYLRDKAQKSDLKELV